MFLQPSKEEVKGIIFFHVLYILAKHYLHSLGYVKNLQRTQIHHH